MAISGHNTPVKEMLLGTERAKIYKLVHDGSATTVSIKPGTGYTIPVGAFTNYTLTSGVYAFTVVAGAGSSNSNITFLAPT